MRGELDLRYFYKYKILKINILNNDSVGKICCCEFCDV